VGFAFCIGFAMFSRSDSIDISLNLSSSQLQTAAAILYEKKVKRCPVVEMNVVKAFWK